MNWAAQEFETVELGDKRLNSRLVKLVKQLAANPTASIPGACGGWGDTAGTYRLLDNERCDWREIIEAHGRCATQRMVGLPVVLCLPDTTELDFNGQTIQGLGPLNYEAQRGMYLHPTYAVSTDPVLLGVLDARMWARGTWRRRPAWGHQRKHALARKLPALARGRTVVGRSAGQRADRPD